MQVQRNTSTGCGIARFGRLFNLLSEVEQVREGGKEDRKEMGKRGEKTGEGDRRKRGRGTGEGG